MYKLFSAYLTSVILAGLLWCYPFKICFGQTVDSAVFIKGYYYGDFDLGRGHYFLKEDGCFYFISAPKQLAFDNDNAIEFGKGKFVRKEKDSVQIEMYPFTYMPLQLPAISISSETLPPYDSIFVTGHLTYGESMRKISYFRPDFTGYFLKTRCIPDTSGHFSFVIPNNNKPRGHFLLNSMISNYSVNFPVPEGGNHYNIDIFFRDDSKYRFVYYNLKSVSQFPFNWPKMIDSMVKLNTYSYLKFISPQKSAFIHEIREIEKGMPEQKSVIEAIIGEIEKE